MKLSSSTKIYLSAIGLVTFSIFSYLLKYLLNVLLARHLSNHAYGDFAVALRVLTIATTVMLLGTNVSARRFLARYLQIHHTKQISNYVGWNFKLISISAIIALFFTLLMTFILFLLHSHGIKALDDYHLAIYMLWITPLTAMTLLLSSYLLCANHYYLSVFFETTGKYLFLLLYFFVSIVFLDMALNDAAILSAFFIVFFVLMSLEIIYITSKTPRKFMTGAQKFWERSKGHRKEWAIVSYRLIFNKIAFVLVCTIDLIIVEIFFHKESAVGHYAAMLTIVSLIWIPSENVYEFIKPKISHYLLEHNYKKLQAMIIRANQVMLSITGIIALFIMIFGKKILSTFGSSYVSVAIPLMILTLANFIGTWTKPAATLLAYSNHEKRLLTIVLFQLSLIIILCSLATYFFGIIGIVCALLIVMVISTFLLNLSVNKLLPISAFKIY